MLESKSFLFRFGFLIVFVVSQIMGIFLLLRGHNLPGGGFIGGLVSGLSLIVLSFNEGNEIIYKILRFPPLRISLIGLLCATLSSLFPVIIGDHFLTQYNAHFKLPLFGDVHIGTPLLFDLGVFLVVIGVFVKITLLLTGYYIEEDKETHHD